MARKRQIYDEETHSIGEKIDTNSQGMPNQRQ